MSDGSTPVTVGQSLTPPQAAGLRFKPNGVPVNSQLAYDVIVAGGATTHWSISLLFDPTTSTVTPAAPVDPPGDSTPTTNASAPDAAGPVIATPVTGSSATEINISAPATTADSSSINASPAASPVKADPPGDYNSVYGEALNIAVPSEEASPETIQVTALPTNGTVVLSDGTTNVIVRRTPDTSAGGRAAFQTEWSRK